MGGVDKFVLAKPAAVPKPKVEGEVDVLPKDFLVNLTDGKFAKLGVGLVFDQGFWRPRRRLGTRAAAAPPTGYGAPPQEAVARDIVTDVVNDQSAKDDQKKGREGIKRRSSSA